MTAVSAPRRPIAIDHASTDRMLAEPACGKDAAVLAPVKSKAQAPACGRS